MEEPYVLQKIMVPQMSLTCDVGWQIGLSGGPTAYIPQSMQIDQTMDLQGMQNE